MQALRLITVLALLFVAAPSSRASDALSRSPLLSQVAVKYVSPSGSDSASGTFARPWRTIQSGIDRLRPGGTLVVRAGVYAENVSITRSGTGGRPITVRSFPRERVVLRPDATSPSYPLKIKNAAYVRVQGLVIEGASTSNTVNLYVLGSTHDVEVSYCEIRGAKFGSGVFVDNGTRGVRLLANLVHDNDEPGEQHHGIYFEGARGLIANNVVYGHDHGFGIQIRTDMASGPTNVLVANNTVSGNALGGIVVEHTASRVTIVNNIAAGNGGTGIRGYFSEEDHAGDPAGRDNVAHDNLVFGNGGYGNLHSDTTRSGGGILSFGAANRVANPRFVNPAARNYRLRPGSPGLGRSLPRYTPARDRDGRRRIRRASLDLGAYER
jgi:parallel beta-helix repeat protein